MLILYSEFQEKFKISLLFFFLLNNQLDFSKQLANSFQEMMVS